MERQEIIDRVWELEESDLIDLWCDYCNDNRLYDDIIFPNDEFFFENYKPMEIAQGVNLGSWRYSDDWVKADVYGYFYSFSYKSEIMEHIDLDPFVDWLEENGVFK